MEIENAKKDTVKSVSQIGEKIYRGRDFEQYKILEKEAEKMGIVPKSGKLYGDILGLPVWFEKGPLGNDIPFQKEPKEFVDFHEPPSSDKYEIWSGLFSGIFHKDNNVEYFDSMTRKKKATERILIEVEGKPVKLVDEEMKPPRSEKIEEGEGEKKPRRKGRLVKKTYSMMWDSNKATLNADYKIMAGGPVQHSFKSQGLAKYERKSLSLTWDFGGEVVDTMEVTREGAEKPETYELGKNPPPIRNDGDIQKVIITKNGELWMNEVLYGKGDKDEQNSQKLLKEISATSKGITWTYSGWKGEIDLDHASTYTTNNPYEDGYVVNNSSNKYAGYPYYDTYAEGVNAPSTQIKRGYYEFPLSSGVINAASITQVSFKFHQTVGNGNPCKIMKIHNYRPSTTTDGTNIYNEIGTRGDILNPVTLNTTGTNRVQNLGAGAVTDLTNRRANGWWAFGIMFVAETNDGRKVDIKSEEAAAIPDPTLEVIYS